MCKHAKSITNTTEEHVIQTYFDRLEQCFAGFQTTHFEILEVTGEAELPFQVEQLNIVEDYYLEAAATFKKFLKPFNEIKLASVESETGSQHEHPVPARQHIPTPRFELPRINLPTFSGGYAEWQSYRDLFLSLVDSNQMLTNVQKLFYLKTTLAGEAANLIKNIIVTDNNYEIAWDTIVRRYHNERIIVTSLLNVIVSQPNIKGDADSLRKLLDTTTETLRALTNLNRPTQYWDDWIVFLVVQKLDIDSRQRWEESITTNFDFPDTNFQTWQQLQVFLQNRFQSLEFSHQKGALSSSSKKTTKDHVKSFHVAEVNKCPCCSKNHHLRYCFVFRKKRLSERKNVIITNKLCFNCFGSDHGASNCTSSNTCKHCNQRHNSLLHHHDTTTTTSSAALPSTSSSTSSSNNLVVSSNFAKSTGQQILLATALISAKANDGTVVTLRALIDQGSQASFITESAVQKLGVPRRHSNVYLQTVGSSESRKTKGLITLQFQSCVTKESNSICVEALVLDTITDIIPHYQINKDYLKEFHNLALADPLFVKPGHVDVLLGADIYGEIILEGIIKGKSNGIVAQNTILGWIISGKLNNSENQINHNIVANHCTISDVDSLLRSFWEIEDIPMKVFKSDEDLKCEAHFESTHRRTYEGRYVVKLPFKEDAMKGIIFLGNSRNIAICRLLQLEKRFQGNSKLKEQYFEFIKEYLNLGHMELIVDSETSLDVKKTYYMPHHAVFKESSTTKLRVVFDASRKSSSGESLNSLLLTGPGLQNDLFKILLRWRKHLVAFTADLAKMYRQVLVDPIDCDYQRIVWRNSPAEPIKDYRLRTITYGTSAAPFLAIKTVQTLAKDEEHRFPLASVITLNDMYVDDICSGADDLETAKLVQFQLIQMFKAGGFQLRKWTSNFEELLYAVDPEDRELQLPISIDNTESIKALGIYWHPATDEFGFKVNLSHEQGISTKRSLLSDASRLFDPLGWLAPSIIISKTLFQKLWLAGITWDQAIPSEIQKHWDMFRSELKCLEQLKIKRWLGNNNTQASCELHGFSDASTIAYSAVVYCKVVQFDGTIQVCLLAAKTKVAPVKQISVPRLELCGALLLARLFKKVLNSMQYNDPKVYAWTDSMVVLAWLRANPSRWKTFIANRTSEILEIVHGDQWKYVKSIENPADCASRGVMPSQLQSHNLWWSGPEWLSTNDLPSYESKLSDTTLEERKTCLLAAATTSKSWNLIDKYSSLSTLLRVTVYCKRFINNCRSKPVYDFIKFSELECARKFWIKSIQSEYFYDDIQRLRSDDTLSRKSVIASLNPYLDEDGILRVGGRLQRSNLQFDRKHPIILPKNGNFTKLILADAHTITLHGSIQLMLNVLRSKYWIINARNVIRQYIHRCNICFRYQTDARQQIMADLPQQRVVPSRPFSHAGIDYAGPLSLKVSKGRGNATTKGYISLFVCMSTKALHLEAVSDLTTSAFLAAFRRFIGRRGLCSNIYTDNGLNFVGASAEIPKLHKKAMGSQEKIISEILANDGVTWTFNPPASPHFGGLWEAGVKSVKFHLKRVLKDSNLTFEELSTILCQIEGILNSRPICALTDDVDDEEALTPGHFLMGTPPLMLPEPSLLEINENRLTRWQRCQQISQHFWKRWSTEYLNRLQQRPKWQFPQPNIKIGELVLVKEENLPPSKWCLGRVTAVHPGADGNVRVVNVKSKNTEYRRPIVKICRLPSNDLDHSI